MARLARAPHRRKLPHLSTKGVVRDAEARLQAFTTAADEHGRPGDR
jgi:hypothetical protein